MPIAWRCPGKAGKIMSYRVQSADTSEAVEKLQLAIFRQKGEAGRSQLMRSLTKTTRWLTWNNLLKLHSGLDLTAVFTLFISHTYGNTLADELRRDLESRERSGQPVNSAKIMISEDILEAILPVIDTFEQLNITYLIAGSIASSAHGIARSTADADLVADLRPEHIAPLIACLQADYYISQSAIQVALVRQSSFNLLHLATGIKVDVFVLKKDPFNQTSFARATNIQLTQLSQRGFRVDAPEDVLLQKLNCYRLGGGVSDRQWLDVLGILKLQTTNLDRDYLEKWSEQLGLNELLHQALEEAGL